MKQKAGNPLHPSLLLAEGPQTLVVTSEGLPVSVPTNLLVLYSSRLLASLLVSHRFKHRTITEVYFRISLRV